MAAIPASVVPPLIKFKPVERQALTDLLPTIANSRVTCVGAPAGFGKTTAIRLWAAALKDMGRPVIWLAARAGFRDVHDFAEALCEAGAAVGFSWPTEPVDEMALTILHSLAQADGRAPVLVIDDAHLLPDDINAFIGTLVANARDGLTTILSTRGRSRIPMARLRSLDCLVEVGAHDLCFTKQETIELLASCAGEPVGIDWGEFVHLHLRGWPAGTMMAARMRPIRDLATIDRDHGAIRLRRHVEAYFEEEVLVGLTQTMRDFLTEISILEAFGREEAEAVTGHADSGQRIAELLDLGLFIDPVEDALGVYQVHPLFRGILYGRLCSADANRARMLHQTAALHFLRGGKSEQALDHARASKDPWFLAQTLDGLAEELTYAGKLSLVVALAATLPSEVLMQFSGIMLCLAWRQIRSLSFGAAEDMLAGVEQDIERLRNDPSSDMTRISHLARLLRHRRAMLLGARDDMPAVEKVTEELLADFGDDNAYVSCTLLAQLMAARRELFHFQDTMKLEAQTRRALGRSETQFSSIALKAAVAPTLALQGKTATARTLLEEALRIAETYDGAGSGLAALPALPLAELCYDMGDLTVARDLIDRHLGVARELGYADQLCAGYLIRSKLLAADGNLSASLAALDEAQLVALECGLERLRSFAMAQQVQILLREDMREAAERAFLAVGFDLTSEPVPTKTPSRAQETVAVAWIRLEVRQYRLVHAQRIAKRWKDLVHRNGAVRSVVQFDLLLAEIAMLSGELTQARRHVRSAVTAAAEPGWIRIFVDSGEVIGRLLQDTFGEGPAADTPADRFAAILSRHFDLGDRPLTADQDMEAGLADRIMGREVEILNLVSSGLRNREIGDRLGLTEGTVKWYMQQIYDKLGVRRRPHAVMRARALGLLV